MKFFPVLLLAMLSLSHASAMAAAPDSNAVEMKVKSLVIDPNSNAPVVVLEAVADKRLLPIWIDVPEARAISMEIEQIKAARPLTHDLIRNILEGLGATLRRVTITELRNNVYIAAITVGHKGQESRIDSRPSDAIAVALRMKAPIFATAQVLAQSKSPPLAGRSEQTYKRLGVQSQDLTSELASLMDMPAQRGVIVADIATASAAMKANIQRGDIITKFNDQPVQSAAELEAAIQAVKSPSQIKLELIKKGKPTTVVIDLP